ncbi:MAG: hypothetical protein RLZZ502_1549 [Pseudomonadota bacterium]|jgi:predicted Zn finger-like uncharacterized protein
MPSSTSSTSPAPGEAITVCPKCSTQFFIREDQIVARQGFVRCGACRGIFNALQNLRDQHAPATAAIDADEHSPLTIMPAVLQNPPDAVHVPTAATQATTHQEKTTTKTAEPERTLRKSNVEAHSEPKNELKNELKAEPVKPLDDKTSSTKGHDVTYELATDELEDRREKQGRTSAGAGMHKPPNEHEEPEVRDIEDLELHSDTSTGRRARRKKQLREEAMASLQWPVKQPRKAIWKTLLWSLVVLILSTLLIVQLLLANYQNIKELLPQAAEHMQKLCSAVHMHCDNGPRRQASALHLQGSELQADPSHKGLYVFVASLRNDSDKALAFPSLVLSLNGLNNQLLTRKVFAPEQYVPGQFDLQRGLPARGEMEFKIFLQANGISPIGFDARHAYLSNLGGDKPSTP